MTTTAYDGLDRVLSVTDPVFYRHSSAEMLEALFAAAMGTPPKPPRPFRTLKQQVDWAAGVAGEFTPGARRVFSEVMADVGALASDLGAECLGETLRARRPELAAAFAKLKSDYDRGTWVWLHHRELFKEALARWFLDRRKPAGTWTNGYAVPKGAAFGYDAFAIKSALMPIVDRYDAGAPGVVIECYTLDAVGEEAPAILLSLFYEGRWNSRARISDGAVNAVCERVLHHVAIKIESASGQMYVVSDGRSKKMRDAIAHAIAKLGLGLTDGLERLPPVRCNLQRLLDPAPFTWDPGHRIESVSVSSLTLGAPSLSKAFRKTYSPSGSAVDVRAQAIAQLSPAERRLARVTKGELRVVFAPRPGQRKGRVVVLSFNGPEACAMDLDCAEEDLSRARYFKRWNLYAPLDLREGGAQPRWAMRRRLRRSLARSRPVFDENNRLALLLDGAQGVHQMIGDVRVGTGAV